MPSSTPRHLPVALVWTVAGLAAGFCLLPYLLATMPALFAGLAARLTHPLWVLVTAQSLQLCVVLLALSYAGLRMGYPLGLDSPLLRAWVCRTDAPAAGRSLAVAAVVGFVAGLIILGMDHAFFRPLPAPLVGGSPPVIVWWMGLLASFYGGIVEELQARLFFMTLLVWLLAKLSAHVSAPERNTPAPWVYWCAVILSAVLFAAAHLPGAANIWGLSGIVVLRVMLLNTLVSLPFGLLFWKRGLEHAMLAHFSADLALHVLGGS